MKLRWYRAQRWLSLLFFFLAGIVFVLCFLLYRLPLEAVAYPFAICAVMGAVFLVVDFLRQRRRYREIAALREQWAELLRRLPEPESVEGAAYRELLESLVYSQRAMAEAANARYADAMDYFTVWAHQVKTPIAAMQLRLQGEDSELSRSLAPDLNRIEQYVDMVMTFLRLNSPDSDYVIREYELDPILRRSLRRFSSEFILRRLSLDYEPTDMRVVTDEKWLSFVVEQLLSNALKYTPKGTITVRAKGNRLTIADTGMGIAPEDLPRIFERGYTGSLGRLDHHASGLGLYLCRRVCENLGVKIAAESELGKGTTMILTWDKKK